MRGPLVSICITTFNRRRLVSQAIESALAQTYENVEVVVVDDGSGDGTRQTIEKRFGSAVTYISDGKNHGIAHAKNVALLNACGEYRAILDSDDYLSDRFVERCLRELDANPDVGVVYVDDVLVDHNCRELRYRPALEWSLEGFLKTRNIRGDSWLARWSVLERTRLHDERFKLEVDYDLFYQLLQVTKFKRIPEYLLHVRSHKGQTTELDRKRPAYWHAAGLGKYGYSIEYAYTRAREFGKLNDWRESIVEGYQAGKEMAKDPAHWEKGVQAVAEGRKAYQPYQIAYYQEIHEKAAAFLDLGGSVLDVGCGDGSGANFKPGITSYVGIDVHLPKPAPHLIQASAEEIPFPDASFDSVLCFSVLQHILHPEKALEEIRRVLKPGGRFASLTCVDDPNPIFCQFWSRDDVIKLLKGHFTVKNFDIFDRRHLVVNCVAD